MSGDTDRRRARRIFDRASTTFDTAAVVQRELRDSLFSRLRLIKQPPFTIVDLGAATGHGARELQKQYPQATVIAVDFSPAMLAKARRQQSWFRRFARTCADARALPFKPASVDWIVSNSMLQHCDPPDDVFAEVGRVLKPGGVFSFTTFGPDTLKELRTAWHQIGQPVPSISLLDMHDIGDALLRVGLSDAVMDVERITVTYADFDSLLQDLKAIGATGAMTNDRAHLGNRRRIDALKQAYEAFRADGVLPVTIEAVFGQVWQPLESPMPRASKSEVRIPLSALRRRP